MELIIICSAIAVVCLVIGYAIGLRYIGSKTTDKLRKRGYTIVHSHSYYDGNTYQFIYNGFDDKLRAVQIKGAIFTDYDDAVANADAHYYAYVINRQSVDNLKV